MELECVLFAIFSLSRGWKGNSACQWLKNLTGYWFVYHLIEGVIRNSSLTFPRRGSRSGYWYLPLIKADSLCKAVIPLYYELNLKLILLRTKGADGAIVSNADSSKERPPLVAITSWYGKTLLAICVLTIYPGGEVNSTGHVVISC